IVKQPCEQRRDRERVHADALVPAKLAGNEVRDLGEEEAAAGGDRSDYEREPQLVALDATPQAPQRASNADERERPDEQKPGAENLSGDAEHRQGDDHVMSHAATPVRG